MSTLRVPVSADDHTLGPGDAPVTVVEYGDYECPYCAAAYPVVSELLSEFDGRVRFVFRNFPLVELHPDAMNAATLAEFAADAGRFWQAHRLLFEHQGELGLDLYLRICDALGLSAEDFERALRDDRYADRIGADEEGGIRSGVNGTPTFFVDGRRVEGGIDELGSAIAARLGRTG